ncbi:ABC transporter permease [Paenibacillus eucommiae]|uniref:Transport permease protein n=1 Tax=Paenibacillus eucommiae TaxID=1355755 RepID=A0ABS4ISA3_9BACL|nr:ABC transporter permease [Paenibacillus eucommiae]MBP1989896.1 ABC-2 type transport system permease protein [Paenibacillus eucommiae]
MTTSLHSSESVTRTSSTAESFRFAISDVWTLTGREFKHWRGQPGTIILGWVFPVMIVLMFGSLFGGAINVTGGAGYFEFLIPGMFAMTMVFGLETTVMAITVDAAKGVTDRFRSMPMSSSAVVLGRCTADMVNSIVGLMILIGSGLLLGWHWHGGFDKALIAVGLLLLLRFSLLWVGIYIGLAAKGPESVVALQILVWPIGFLSSVYVDPSSMPTWLGAMAEWNPLSATATAARELFMNPGWQGDTWATQNSILLAIIWPILLVVVFLPLSVRRYRRLRS